MAAPDPDLGDIAVMREQGDLKAYLMSLTGRVPKRAAAPVTPAPEVIEEPKRPGAWPTGTRPATPAAPQDPAAWDQAVHEYRAWTAAGCPDGDFACECGCTPITRRHT
jgi:hypothetical protein